MMCCHHCHLRSPRQECDVPRKNQDSSEGLRCGSPVCSGHDAQSTDTTESFDPLEGCADCPQRTTFHLCLHDADVITGLARRDEFAALTAHFSLDTLVSCESSDLICELFHNADSETRTDLWHRMTSCHPDRLDLLNQIFERLSLPPLEIGEWPDRLSDYRLAIS